MVLVLGTETGYRSLIEVGLTGGAQGVHRTVRMHRVTVAEWEDPIQYFRSWSTIAASPDNGETGGSVFKPGSQDSMTCHLRQENG